MDIENEIEEFSKFMLVTIIAVFAFTSKTLLESTDIAVKISYILSLCFSILSLNSAFQVLLVKVNYLFSRYTETDNQEIKRIPFQDFKRMRKHLQAQFNYTLISLVLLVATIFIVLFF